MAKIIGDKSALDWALAQIADDERKPGEFTAREFFLRAKEGGSAVTYQACRYRLGALADAGTLRVRVGKLNGTTVLFYRQP
jgi:hypothetical protein